MGASKPTPGASPLGHYALIALCSSLSLILVALAAALPFLPFASKIPFTQQGITALACVATSISFLLYTSLPSSKAARRKLGPIRVSTPKVPAAAAPAKVGSSAKKTAPKVSADKPRSASSGRSVSASKKQVVRRK